MRACFHPDQNRRTKTQKSLSRRPMLGRRCQRFSTASRCRSTRFSYKIPTATEEANQYSDPEEKEAEHGTELYQINDWKYCCKLLILRSARVLARDSPRMSSPITQHFATGCLLNIAV